MLGRLIPIGGGPPLLLLTEKVSIGRSPATDVSVSCGSISGQHCELELINGYWWVTDLGSRNGTAVNNVRCQRARVIPGNVLRLANHRFWVDYAAPDARSEDDAAFNLLLVGDSKVELSAASAPSRNSLTSAAPVPSVSRQSLSRSPRQRDQSADVICSLGKLVPCWGGDPVPLLNSPLVVGRHSGCDIALKFADVSSAHCMLTFKDGFWIVEDQQSTNGIRVNGTRVERKVLFPQDAISVASHRFHIHYVPQGSLPPSDGDSLSEKLLQQPGHRDGDSSCMEQQKLNDKTEDEGQPGRFRL